MLDEATAAAEAATMMYGLRSRNQVKSGVERLFIDQNIFPQTLSVLKTRMRYVDIEVVVGDYRTISFEKPFFGAIIQYPNGDGSVEDYRGFVEKANEADCKVAVATDLMALTLLTPPGEWGADIALEAVRDLVYLCFMVDRLLHFATKDEYKRSMPGRIIGISKDTMIRGLPHGSANTRTAY